MSTTERVDLSPPKEVIRIARRLQAAGYETWTVGGGVRDALAGRVPGDWDLATAALPGQVQGLFKRTVAVGIEHGTVGVLGKDGHLYEVTTFRRDVETFGRKARVVFASTLEEDLERRDFTINAVAWDPISGELRDPHHGAEHLRQGILRTVGDPTARFSEDWLRVLRALRFAGRFDMKIDPRTWAAVQASTGELHSLSAERIREELYKVLGGTAAPSRALKLYAESGVLRELYPELAASVGVPDPQGGDVWSHLLATVDQLSRWRITLRLSALFHDATKRAGVSGEGSGADDHAATGAAAARAVLQRLKASNADMDKVVHLVAQHSDLPLANASEADVRRWLRRVGLEHWRDLFRLRMAEVHARGGAPMEAVAAYWRVRSVLAAQPPLQITDLAISGTDLRELGINPGPRYGEILRELLERVTDDPRLNRREALMRIAAEIL